MTTWDKIYKQHQQGESDWATLSEGIHPLFIQLINKHRFGTKYALDIGCGTGKYLRYLREQGFQTDGIDSSKTAVEMTKKILAHESNICCTNMFEFKIPANKYDLILSVSTIHHGTKDEVQSFVQLIYSTLKNDGVIFITVPNIERIDQNELLQSHKERFEGTFIPLTGPEKGLPHSFYSENDAKKLFSMFNNIEIHEDQVGRWIITATK